MTTSAPHPPNWYPDPAGRHEYRYWNGQLWTEDVSNRGVASKDPFGAAAEAVPTVHADAAKVARTVERKTGMAPGQVAGGGTLFTEPILVVHQKAKLIELNNEYGVFDQHGNQLGVVRQVGQSAARKALRLVSKMDSMLSHTLQVLDARGQLVLQISRPPTLFKSNFGVQDARGTEIGQIVQQNAIGKIRFAYMAGGQQVGSMNGENWRAWNFAIRDHTDTEVARVTKTFQGLAKAAFTTADNYVVQLHRPLEEPLRSLVVASALSIDTALSQSQS